MEGVWRELCLCEPKVLHVHNEIVESRCYQHQWQLIET